MACSPTASIVLAGGFDDGIYLLERGVEGYRVLFPDQAVHALSFTSRGDLFAFACDQEISLVETGGYTVVYSLMVTEKLQIKSLVFVQDQGNRSGFTYGGNMPTDRSPLNDI